MPPFLGFWPKLLLLQSFLAAGNWLLVFAILANALLTLIAGARLWTRIAWRPAAAAGGPMRGSGGAILLAGTVLILSLAPGLLLQLSTSAAHSLITPSSYVTAVGTRSMNWLFLVASLTWELIRGAVSVAWLALQPRLRLRPAIVAFPLTVTTDSQITLLANMITLTPGTLSMDVSDDRRTLYIHTIDLADREALIGRIAGGFETRVLRVMR